MKSSLCRFVVTLACVVLSAPLQAEKADRSKPMNIESDTLRYDDVKQTSVFTGKVLVDHDVRHRQKLTMRAVAAFDARLLADSWRPLVGARRRIARLSSGFAFPPQREYVGAPAEQVSKERNLFRSGHPVRLSFLRYEPDDRRLGFSVCR